jgi:microcystin-dependent protein
MADPFVAEIRIFPFNFAPRGWAWCDGQILPISQNTALFSLLGTTYGGNGSSNFALPDLQGRSAMQHGQGPGLSLRDLGESGGSEAVTLLASEVPGHTHALQATSSADTGAPAGAALANVASGAKAYRVPGATTFMAADALQAVGGSPHNNRQPYLTLYFAIALQGVFPPRT